MNFIDNINSETLIICNNNTKKQILNMHKLIPIKFMTIKEFIHKYLFDYDEKTIMYIVRNYNIKYEIAKEYLDNLYYIEDKEYKNEKLLFLKKIKEDLDNHNLFIYNETFRKYIKRIPIIIYDIELDSYLKRILDGLNYKIIDRQYNNYQHQVYEFETMEDEVSYVANEIAKLVDQGISPSQIKLTNIDSSYYNTIERIFTLHNLKAAINYHSKIASYDIVKKFIESYKTSDDIELALNNLDNKSKIYQELIKIINKYQIYNDKELLIYKIEEAMIESDHYTNEIEVIDYLEYESNDNEYIFMLGFNDSLIPKNYTDTNYITDNICNLVGLDTTIIKNSKLKIKTIKAISNIKNLVITYKLRDYKSSYYPSVLINNYEIVKKSTDYLQSYSELHDKINLIKMYDDYFKYGQKNQKFDIYNSNYNIKYNSYSNKFSGINRIMDKLTLSYSKMQTYNKCAFRYYLGNILKLDIYEENFSTVIGSMVHYIMEKCLSNNDINVEKYASVYLQDKTFTKKEQFFLEKYKECIKELIDETMLEKEYMLFNQAMYEKKIDIDYGDNIHFIGIIDKVLYYISDDTTYIALIDYKTGADDISLKYLKYGLNIQLPIYLYLSTKLDFKNILYTGFYLQKFNIVDKDYRLIGYSNSNKEILSIIDKNYDNSKIIRSLKTVSDGSFSKNSKILSNEEINDIKDIVKKEISKVINQIKNNQFTINPKVAEGKNIGCEYCKFKDICFMTKEDEVKIYPQEFRGEN